MFTSLIQKQIIFLDDVTVSLCINIIIKNRGRNLKVCSNEGSALFQVEIITAKNKENTLTKLKRSNEPISAKLSIKHPY